MSSKTPNTTEIKLSRRRVVGLLKAIYKDYPENRSVRLLETYSPSLSSIDENLYYARVLVRIKYKSPEYATYGYIYGQGWSRLEKPEANSSIGGIKTSNS